MNTKPRNLGVRLDSSLARRLERFESLTGVEATKLARSCLEAALDHFDRHGSITFPLIVEPSRGKMLTASSVVGEEPAAFGKRSRKAS